MSLIAAESPKMTRGARVAALDTKTVNNERRGGKSMRRMGSKWFSVLGALFALVMAVGTIAAVQGCDHTRSDEDSESNS